MSGSNGIKKVLWVDDEIEHLRHHIDFLASREYGIVTASNGETALSLFGKTKFDLVLLDALMPFKNGLATLADMKKINPDVPIVMAMADPPENRKIPRCDGVLKKPIDNTQLLTVCKETIDAKGEKIPEHIVNRYYRYHSKSLEEISEIISAAEWITFFDTLHKKGYEIEKNGNEAMRQAHAGLKYEASKKFSEFVTENYPEWICGGARKPLLAVDIISKCVLPKLQEGISVVLIILNGMRLSDFIIYEKTLKENFDVKAGRFVSLLPAAPEFTVPALVSGLFPNEVFEKFGEVFSDDGKIVPNVMDKMMRDTLIRGGIENAAVKFFDLDDPTNIDRFVCGLKTAAKVKKNSLAFNVVFSNNTNSPKIPAELFDFIKSATDADRAVVLTSGNGHVLCRRTTEIYETNELADHPRYVIGKKAAVDVRNALLVEETNRLKLPPALGSVCAMAFDRFCFVLPGKEVGGINEVVRYGGLMPDELIMPVYVCRKPDNSQNENPEDKK